MRYELRLNSAMDINLRLKRLNNATYDDKCNEEREEISVLPLKHNTHIQQCILPRLST